MATAATGVINRAEVAASLKKQRQAQHGLALLSGEGWLGTPQQTLKFFVATATAFFGVMIFQTVKIWYPNDPVVLLISVVASAIAATVLPPLARQLRRHNSHVWALGWIQFLDFVVYVLVFFMVAYLLEMLQKFWVSGGPTVVEIVAITIVLVLILIVILAEVGERLKSSDANAKRILAETLVAGFAYLDQTRV